MEIDLWGWPKNFILNLWWRRKCYIDFVIVILNKFMTFLYYFECNNQGDTLWTVDCVERQQGSWTNVQCHICTCIFSNHFKPGDPLGNGVNQKPQNSQTSWCLAKFSDQLVQINPKLDGFNVNQRKVSHPCSFSSSRSNLFSSKE